MGAKEPPVLHILIHSIFGTRKGTNISVLNSFPSPPLQPPVPLRLPSLPSLAPQLPLPPHMGQGTLQLVWGWPGSSYPPRGPAGPPPLAELWCSPPTLQVLRGGGAAGGDSCGPSLGHAAWERRPGRVWAQRPGPCPRPTPSQGPPPPPSRGLASSPRCWATTAEKPPCLRPEVASSALRVCAHMCECVKLGVRLSALEPLVCLTGGWPQGATLD